MSKVETSAVTRAYREQCEDRVAVFDSTERTVIVVADGAGGVGSGDVAADFVLREIETAMPSVHSANEWAEMLRQVDCRISAGESTAVVIDIRPLGIAGASVGDSQAWIIKDGSVVDLTANQNRKPLLGSGEAFPMPIMNTELNGVLLVATDGFFSYANRDAITRLIARSDFHSIPRQCIELVRLPSGDLWDDIGIVVARVQPQNRPANAMLFESPRGRPAPHAISSLAIQLSEKIYV